MSLRTKLRKGSDIYYAVGTIRYNGKTVRVRSSLDTTDFIVAEAECASLERRLKRKHAGGYDGHSFLDAVRGYLDRREFTSATTSGYLSKFSDMWGHIDMSEFDIDLIEDYIEERLASVSGSTVRREVNALSPVFRFAYRRRWTKGLLTVERPSDGPPRLRNLDHGEYDRIVTEYTDINAQRLVVFLLNSGARIGEALKLDWRDVKLDAENPYVILSTRKRKGGREARRTVPVNSKMKVVLDAIRPVDISVGGRVFYFWRDQQAAGKAVKRHGERAGIGDFTAHDLRRTFATRALEAGTSPRVVADLLGHTTLAMVMQYAVPPEHMKITAVQEI